MAEILMPQMGESIAEGTLTRWFKKPGELVKRDEPLFEISTDKVDAEIPAPADGVLEKILVAEGTTVEVNTVVGILGSATGGGAAPASKGPAPAARVEAPKPSAPAAKPPAAPTSAAVLPERPQQQRSTILATENGEGAADAVQPAAPHNGEVEGDLRKTRSSPLVRRIAREQGITDLSAVPGTGIGGRVTKQDILRHVESIRRGGAAPAAMGAPTGALPVLRLPRKDVRVEKMTTMRRKIAEHMVQSRRVSAHVHSVFEIDVDRIAKLRLQRKDDFERRHGVKLTYMPFFMKSVVDALVAFPYVNASLDGEEILLHNGVNLGIAVALESGLIVPVVRNAHELSLVGLQKRVTDLATRARSKQLVPDEVQGGTFTITNPGAFGNEFGIPIINQPQVAILGIGGVKKRAVVVDGDAIAVRHTVFMCLSYDHRLVDGALADRFMGHVRDVLEKWDVESLE